MKTEIEVKFTQVDIDKVRERLEKTGAHLEQPMRLMRRVLIEEPHHKAENSFLRVRDEGDKITLTFKRRKSMDLSESAIDNTKEIEVTVSSFDDTVELLHEAGWSAVSYQESKRETWTLEGAEIVIDEWPWLKPYVEIEAMNEKTVRLVADLLGFDWEDAFHGRIDHVYEQEYVFDAGFKGPIDIPSLKFGEVTPAQMTPKGDK